MQPTWTRASRRGAGRVIRGRRALHGRRQAGGCLAGLTSAWLTEPETPPRQRGLRFHRREEVAVNTIHTSPSSNGRGSDAWMRSWTNLGIDRRDPGYCRVTFDHPPINAITATTVAELAELVELIEADADLNVVVFDSANPAFYLTHNDTENDPSVTAVSPLGPTGIRAWHDV